MENDGMNMPEWLKPLGVAVAVLVVALLIAGELGAPYRGMHPSEGYDQSRTHWNTKNTTRFGGASSGEVAARVGQATYPATDPANTPDVVILYAPDDWQGGLAAASLLRPLNAILLPATANAQDEVQRLQPRGSTALGGPESSQVLLMNGVRPSGSMPAGRDVATGDVAGLLTQAGAPPRNVIVVDPNDPATALLAAPWAAYSGDLIIFDAADAPSGVPRYTLGNLRLAGAKQIAGRTPADTAVAFATYEDSGNRAFGWAMHEGTASGYRAYTLARPDDPSTALLSANLAVRGKVGPLLWTDRQELPQVVNDYLWSQRAAFWVVPNEGPFHHVWVLGGLDAISFPAQAQADYALEIGPYRMKGPGLAGLDMLAAGWAVLGIASAVWIAFHAARFLPQQGWTMRLAWPMLALTFGPFGIPIYWLAYRRPVIRHGRMTLWDRPLWLQGLVATASAVGFGGPVMVATGFVMTLVGLPLIANNESWLFWLGSPMVLVMIANFVVAVLVSWPLFQTPMLGMHHGLSYRQALGKALPIVVASMASVSLAMFPGMWWLMMWNLLMMPTEESILWFGVMFFTVFMGFLIAWPFNYLFVRTHQKSGLM